MKNILLLLLISLPALLLVSSGNTILARAQDDIEDEMVDVEGEETAVTDEGGDEEESGDKPTGSPDADTTILFTKPVHHSSSSLDLPAGDLVEFLIGFTNKGADEFVLETVDASFHYPMDFSYYIQNFSTLAYERSVKPKQQATLAYSFIPAEAFAGRPFGLTINLRYRDLSGNQYIEGVYNETVNIIELDEGLDGETFFLYVLLGAAAVLLLVVGQQFLVSSVGRSRTTTQQRKQVETGTTDKVDVDYEWLPKEMLHQLNKSPRLKTSPKTSPKTRKAKRSAGSDN